MGHDGPGHVAISDEKPVLRALKLFHGKAGAGLSVEFKVRLGAVTILGVSQTADGRLKLLAAEGESIPGPTFRIGNTNSADPVREGAGRVHGHVVRPGPDAPCRARGRTADRTDPQDRRPARDRARGDRMSVRFLGPDTDAYVASVERHAAEFEEESGISLELEIVPSDLYFSNRIQHLLDGQRLGRRVHVGPGPGLGASRRRIRAPARRVPRTRRRRLRRRGLQRRPDPLQPVERPFRRSARRGCAPRDPRELRVVQPRVRSRSARASRSRRPADLGAVLCSGAIDRRSTGGRVRGFAQRGTGAWHTMYTGFATQYWSYGASDFEGGRCAIASPTAVRATDDFITALRAAGRMTGLTSAGTSSRSISRADGTASSSTPTTTSPTSRLRHLRARRPDRICPTAARPDRSAPLQPWTWSVVMNSRANDKEAAWRFIEWATGRKFLLRSAFEGNMNPTRTSIWDDEAFRAHLAGWGGFYDVSRSLVERDAAVLVTPSLELPRDCDPLGRGAAGHLRRSHGNRRGARVGSRRDRCARGWAPR